MADTNIEWADRVLKTAARRAGVSPEEYRALVAAGRKFCWRCRGWRSRQLFVKDASRGDGLGPLCVNCRRSPKQLRLLTTTRAEAARLRYAVDPAYRAERRQHVHARRRSTEKIPSSLFDELMADTGGLCVYCDEPATTLDHIVPVADGGRSIRSNLAPSCRSCNSSKRTSHVYDFIDRRAVRLTQRLESALDRAISIGQLDV